MADEVVTLLLDRRELVGRARVVESLELVTQQAQFGLAHLVAGTAALNWSCLSVPVPDEEERPDHDGHDAGDDDRGGAGAATAAAAPGWPRRRPRPRRSRSTTAGSSRPPATNSSCSSNLRPRQSRRGTTMMTVNGQNVGFDSRSVGCSRPGRNVVGGPLAEEPAPQRAHPGTRGAMPCAWVIEPHGRCRICTRR